MGIGDEWHRRRVNRQRNVGNGLERMARAWLCHEADSLPQLYDAVALTSKKIDLLPH